MQDNAKEGEIFIKCVLQIGEWERLWEYENMRLFPRRERREMQRAQNGIPYSDV